MARFKNQRIVLPKGSRVPHIRLYYGDIPEGRDEVAGVDYIGFVIIDSWTNKPYYRTCEEGNIYLNAAQIEEVRKLCEGRKMLHKKVS